MRNLLFSVFALAALSLPSALRAQCTPVPGTGCPGALPVQCGGTPQIGQAMKFACPNSGRAQQQLLIAGLCASTPWPLPASVQCVGGCTVGVDPTTLIAIPTAFTSVVLQIPNNNGLIGLNVCFQCLDVVAGPSGACLTLSQAVQITIV